MRTKRILSVLLSVAVIFSMTSFVSSSSSSSQYAMNVNVGTFDETTQSITVTLDEGAPALDVPTVTAPGNIPVVTEWTPSAEGTSYTLTFPYGLPLSGEYTAVSKLRTESQTPITFTFNATASSKAIYDFKIADLAGNAIESFGGLDTLKFSYKAIGTTNQKIYFAYYKSNKLLSVMSETLKEQDTITVPLTDKGNKLLVFIWENGTINPVYPQIKYEYPLIIGGDFVDGEGNSIDFMKDEETIVARVLAEADVPPTDITVNLKLMRKQEIIFDKTVPLNFDEKGAGEASITLNETAQEDDELILVATNGVTEYVCKRLYYEQLVSIATIKDNKDAIYTLTTDDGIKPTTEWLDTKLKEFGLKATMGLVPDYMGKIKGNDVYMTWEEAQNYVSNGNSVWGVANHTKAHKQSGDGTVGAKRFDQLPESMLKVEINEGRAILREKFPTEKIVGLYTPGGQTNDLIRKIVAEEHFCLREVGGGINTLPISESNLYKLKSVSIGTAFKNDSFEALKSNLDNAISQKGWMVEMWHGVGDDCSSWGGNVSKEAAEAYLEYVAQKQEEGKIWVTTLDEACVYAMQRLKTRISLTSKTDETLTFTILSPSEPKNIYDAELTLNIKLPNGWESANVKMDGKTLQSTVKNGVLTVNVHPEGTTLVVEK